MNPAPSWSRWAEHTKAALGGLLGARPAPPDAEATAEPDHATAEPNDVVEAEATAGPDYAAAEPDYATTEWAGLEKQIVRLGREQFKLGSLLEAQQGHLQAILQQLAQDDSAQRRADRAEARLELIQQWLPALDGLDQALATGEQFLDRLPASTRPAASAASTAIVPSGAYPASRWVSLVAWPVVLAGLALRRPAPTPPADELRAWREAFAAWLRGLELVRARWRATLAAEGVRSIDTVGQPFDPHRHVAVDTAPAGPDVVPGHIVAEVRAGYAASDRVLRYAEVIVARANDAPEIDMEEEQPTAT